MDEPPWIFSSRDIAAKLPAVAEQFRFHYALRHGTMKVGLYAPRSEDMQGPHKQDELYIIISGSGFLVKIHERKAFAPHDVIFIPAGVEHRFENFSDDFATWVIFWGADGGEVALKDGA